LVKTRASSISNKKLPLIEKEGNFTANILGRTFEEVLNIYDAFGSAAPDRFYMLFIG
jgi:hypothetical protein